MNIVTENPSGDGVEMYPDAQHSYIAHLIGEFSVHTSLHDFDYAARSIPCFRIPMVV